VRLDGIDRKILALLQVDGRATLTDLAQQVNLSVSRCQRRLREMERAGVIRGYRAEVDGAAIGVGFEVILFVTLHGLDQLDDFDAAVDALPNVVQAQRLFGQPDVLIRVVTEDLPAYQRLYDHQLSRLPGVQTITSTIVMKNVVPARALPT
jgi:DNA-binding Lrp family transcriptional regulator